MTLTDSLIRAAKSQAKSIRLYDTGDMYLELPPSGGKWLR